MGTDSDDRDRRHLERWRVMVRACRHLTDTHEEAEDCASAALLQIMEREDAWQDQSNAFYVTVARRRAIDLARGRARARHRDHRLTAQSSLLNEDLAVGVADRDEARWLVETISPRLSPSARLVLERTANGQSASDAAAELGMSKRAAESHLLRTRRIARVALAATMVQLAAFARRLLTRSSTPLLAPLVSAASVLIFVLAPGPESVGERPAPPTQQTRLDVQAFAPIEPTAAIGAPHRPPAPLSVRAPVRPALGKIKGNERAVVRHPTTAAVTVKKGRTADHESSTLTVVAHCLRDIEISAERIGCAGPA